MEPKSWGCRWTWTTVDLQGGLEGGTELCGAMAIFGYTLEAERKQRKSDLHLHAFQLPDNTSSCSLKEQETSYNRD